MLPLKILDVRISENSTINDGNVTRSCDVVPLSCSTELLSLKTLHLRTKKAFLSFTNSGKKGV